MTLRDYKHVKQLTGQNLINAYNEYMQLCSDYNHTIERIRVIESLLMDPGTESQTLTAEFWDLTNEMTLSKINTIPSISTFKDIFKYESEQSNRGADYSAKFEKYLQFTNKGKAA